MKNSYLSYVTLVIKIIKKSHIMLKFAVDYVFKLYKANPDIIDSHYLKDYSKIFHSSSLKTSKEALQEIDDHYKKKQIDVKTALKTAFYMRFIKEDAKFVKLVLEGEPYVRITDL